MGDGPDGVNTFLVVASPKRYKSTNVPTPCHSLAGDFWLPLCTGFSCASKKSLRQRAADTGSWKSAATLRVAVDGGRVGAHLPHSVALNKLLNLSAPVFFLRGVVVRINELGHAEPLDQRAWHVISAI